jgi:hypothetical protein
VCHVKEDPDAGIPKVIFDSQVSSITWSVDQDGNVTGDGTDGIIILYGDALQMSALDEGKYYLDVEFNNTATGKRNTLVQGTWTVVKDSSRL